MKWLFSAAAFVVLAWPSVGQAFATCQDAWNYGWNTGQIYSGLTYKRLDCDVASREDYEATLATTVSDFVASGIDTDTHLICLYAGMYNGLLSRASTEYDNCAATAYDCIGRATVGRNAASAVAALYRSLKYTFRLTAVTVADNFALADVRLGGAQVCDACDFEKCEAAIADFFVDSEIAVDQDVVDELVDSNCSCL